MKHRLKRVDPLQAAKMAAALVFLVGLMLTPYIYLTYVIAPNAVGFGSGIVFGLPFLCAGFGFALTALTCACYNGLARWLGGIEIDLSVEPRT